MSKLSPVAQKFILHWGEMGARWGLNRTVAQVHALLFLSPRPLDAEEICNVLGLARSNASTSLRELQNWGIIKVVHVLGARRDHYESMKDVYEMFRTIIAVRKRREVDPTLQLLRECVAEGRQKGSSDPYTSARLQDLAEFFELGAALYEKTHTLSPKSLQRMARMGDKLLGLLGAE